MNLRHLLLGIVLLAGGWSLCAKTFTVGTYNVELYIDRGFSTVPPKSAAAKSKVQESILALQADVLALQEFGTTNLLVELQETLRKRGLTYPFWEWVEGPDTNLHLALLSKFPIVARRPHASEAFLLGKRRFFVSRGFLEVDIQVEAGYAFTLMSAHLKSKRFSLVADEEEIRAQEAIRLREHVARLLTDNPKRNLILLGDFNDHKSTRTLQTLLGKGSMSLVDTRPSERRVPTISTNELSNLNWTHFFSRDDVYSRLDYILISSGFAREWIREESYVLARPDWREASDHRPVLVQFDAIDR